MNVLDTIRNRRSCRAFSDEKISDDSIHLIVEAAVYAPSPLNLQPWNLTVVTRAEKREEIILESITYKEELLRATGWKWLSRYDVTSLRTVPVMIVVSGDQSKSGADAIMEKSGAAWRDACSAAIQNMLLTAESLGLASLWFTMFSKERLSSIIESTDTTIPVAIVMLGKQLLPCAAVPRKGINEKVRYLR